MTVVPVRREDVPTPAGLARVHLQTPARPVGLLVLGHGAGGGIEAPDLRAARDAGLAVGLAVALVEQPWRVAGRRVAEAPPRLDAAWRAVIDVLPDVGPLVVGGRSSGARVACRTAGDVRAAAVLVLAFPLVARNGSSRLPELVRPDVPVLVVQGARDSFGVPEAQGSVAVHVIPAADHAFRVRRADGRTARDVAEQVRGVVGGWLTGVLAQAERSEAQTLT